MCKSTAFFALLLVALSPMSAYAQSATEGIQFGPLLLIISILLVIVVGSALIIRRFQFASKNREQSLATSPKSAPTPEQPALQVVKPDAAFEEAEAQQRQVDRLSVMLSDIEQSLAFLSEKIDARQAEADEHRDLLNIATRQHDLAFQEIQATRGLLDFHKMSLQHMGDADPHRKMQLEDAIRDASRAVIKTDKEQAEREDRIRTHQARIDDLEQECEYLAQEQSRLTNEVEHINGQLTQLRPARAA